VSKEDLEKEKLIIEEKIERLISNGVIEPNEEVKNLKEALALINREINDHITDKLIIVKNRFIKIYKDAENASIIGDTVGDPLKDTSGPSLNILIKLSSIISVVFAGVFVNTTWLKVLV
jgi:hypothetical protein